MNQFYDNHANDIEFFEIKKPKVKRVRDERNLFEMTIEELNEKKIEIDILHSELLNLHAKTGCQKTLNRVTKLTTYKIALNIAIKKRLECTDVKDKSKTIKHLRMKIAHLVVALDAQKNKTKNVDAQRIKDNETFKKLKEALKEKMGDEKFIELMKSLN